MSENKNNHDLELRIIILGISEVGKTCIWLKYFDDKFYENSISTIGIDFKTKFFVFNGVKVKVNYVDTAGQERFQSISANYLKNSNGIMFVYSIDNRQSLVKLNEWMKTVAGSQKPIVLIGNKCDLENRDVDTQEGEEYAKKYNCKFYETSAKTGQNVNEVFHDIALLTYEAMKSTIKTNKNVKLTQSNVGGKKNSCCAKK
jgi:small GTP-binding protein